MVNLAPMRNELSDRTTLPLSSRVRDQPRSSWCRGSSSCRSSRRWAIFSACTASCWDAGPARRWARLTRRPRLRSIATSAALPIRVSARRRFEDERSRAWRVDRDVVAQDLTSSRPASSSRVSKHCARRRAAPVHALDVGAHRGHNRFPALGRGDERLVRDLVGDRAVAGVPDAGPDGEPRPGNRPATASESNAARSPLAPPPRTTTTSWGSNASSLVRARRLSVQALRVPARSRARNGRRTGTRTGPTGP